MATGWGPTLPTMHKKRHTHVGAAARTLRLGSNMPAPVPETCGVVPCGELIAVVVRAKHSTSNNRFKALMVDGLHVQACKWHSKECHAGRAMMYNMESLVYVDIHYTVYVLDYWQLLFSAPEAPG